MKNKIKITLQLLGYEGDFTLSNIIDWIRIEKKFTIWIEHGHTKKNGVKTHDVTTKLGCHRGLHETYELAQEAGIEIYIKYYTDTFTLKN